MMNFYVDRDPQSSSPQVLYTVNSATCLRAPYELPGTDGAYGATAGACGGTSAVVLYGTTAVSVRGTDGADGGTSARGRKYRPKRVTYSQ
eukprot:1420413-Rhodomonas_salina.3